MTQTDQTSWHEAPDPGSPPRRPRGRVVGALAAGLSVAVVITAIVMAAGQDDDEVGASSDRPASDSPQSGGVEGGTGNQPGGGERVVAAEMHDGVFEPGTATATMYYIGPENSVTGSVVLFAEPHSVEASSPEDAVREFLTSRPIDADYRSGWPEGLDVADIQTGGPETTVDLVGDADLAGSSGLDRQAAEMAIQGLIRTAGVSEGTVRITHGGEPVARLLGVPVGNGVEVLPEQAGDYSQTTRAAIQVTSPVENQTLTNPVVVTGNANVFEGNVSWQLLDAQGREIDSGFETAAMLEWADFEVRLGKLDPGTYTFRALEYSMEDGSEMNVDDKTFTVQ
jgi:hypothetical protein